MVLKKERKYGRDTEGPVDDSCDVYEYSNSSSTGYQ